MYLVTLTLPHFHVAAITPQEFRTFFIKVCSNDLHLSTFLVFDSC